MLLKYTSSYQVSYFITIKPNRSGFYLPIKNVTTHCFLSSMTNARLFHWKSPSGTREKNEFVVIHESHSHRMGIWPTSHHTPITSVGVQCTHSDHVCGNGIDDVRNEDEAAKATKSIATSFPFRWTHKTRDMNGLTYIPRSLVLTCIRLAYV